MKIRKIASLALAALLVVAFCVPAFAATHTVTPASIKSPVSGTTLKGTNESFTGGGAAQTAFAGFEVGAGKSIDNAWLTKDVVIKVYYTSVWSENKPLSIRLWAADAEYEESPYEQVSGGNGLSVYPDANGANTRHESLGGDKYAVSFTYSDMVACFGATGQSNGWVAEYYVDTYSSVDDFLKAVTFIDLKTRNTGEDLVTIDKVEISTGGSTGGTTGGNSGTTTTPKNPSTGDSTVFFAIAALAVSGAAVFFLRKRVTA